MPRWALAQPPSGGEALLGAAGSSGGVGRRVCGCAEGDGFGEGPGSVGVEGDAAAAKRSARVVTRFDLLCCLGRTSPPSLELLEAVVGLCGFG